MEIEFETIFIIKNNKKIELSLNANLSKYLKLNFENEFYIRHDLRNRIYFKLEGKEIILSNSLKGLIKDVNQIDINQDIIDNYKKAGFIPSPYTFIRNIFCIPFYSGIKINNKIFLLKKFYPKKSDPFVLQEEFESYMREQIIANSDENTALFFSGGSDSLFIFYNLIKERKICIKNIIVKMKGIEKEFHKAKDISNHFHVATIILEEFSSDFKENINKFIENQYEPIQDPIVPVYMELVSKSSVKGHKVYFDGQGADSLLMGLPHNLLVNLYNPFLKNVFKLMSYFFITKAKPNSKFKRVYYRMGKVVNALSKDDWISCFLCSIDIDYSDKLFSELYSNIENNYKYFKCRHKSIALFFIVKILDSREMQKYRCLSSDIKIILPFLEKDLIDRVFSTNTNFFIDKLFKKKPIYKFINKHTFKVSNFKTSPFFVDYTIDGEDKTIYDYSINKLNELLDL
jgi:hypothetical protein